MRHRVKTDPYYTGIVICGRWDSYANFKEDMRSTWFKGAILDRRDNSKGYEPSNCRWVTYAESNQNRSSVKVTEAIADQIRELVASGRTQASISRELSIGHRTVSNIVNNVQWQSRGGRFTDKVKT